jgi:hypothetical protein
MQPFQWVSGVEPPAVLPREVQVGQEILRGVLQQIGGLGNRGWSISATSFSWAMAEP